MGHGVHRIMSLHVLYSALLQWICPSIYPRHSPIFGINVLLELFGHLFAPRQELCFFILHVRVLTRLVKFCRVCEDDVHRVQVKP